MIYRLFYMLKGRKDKDKLKGLFEGINRAGAEVVERSKRSGQCQVK